MHEDVDDHVSVTNRVRGFCSYEQIAEAIVEAADTVEPKRGQRRGGRNTLYAAAGTSLRKLVIYLHADGVTCESRLSMYSHWDALVFPAVGLIIRSWCATFMGGLDPDQLSDEGPARLIQLWDEISHEVSRGVKRLDFGLHASIAHRSSASLRDSVGGQSLDRKVPGEAHSVQRGGLAVRYQQRPPGSEF